jgi:hypothetical protein
MSTATATRKTRRRPAPEPTPAPEPDWIRIPEAMAMGVGSRVIKLLIRERRLSCRQLPRAATLVRRDEIEELVRASTFERRQTK